MNLLKLSLPTLLISAGLVQLVSIPTVANETQPVEIEASGYINPDYISQYIVPGQSVSIDRTIKVNIKDIIQTTTTSTVPDKLDLLFLADNTDSMGSAIANVQENAQSILNTLSDTYTDVQFGVSSYYGDPKEISYSYEETGERTNFTKSLTYLDESKTCTSGQGESYPCYKYEITYTEGENESKWTSFVDETRHRKLGDFSHKTWEGYKTVEIKTELGANDAYQLQNPIGNNRDSTLDAIANWSTSSGGDWKEGSFFALHQAATNGADINGYGTNYNTNWRDDAKKVIVWFGDAQAHTETVDQTEVIEALREQDISVVAIHTKSTLRSESQGLNADAQASTIAESTSGAFANVYSSELSDTIVSLIGESVFETTTTVISPTIDLDFYSSEVFPDLDVSYTCIDDLGCNDVKDGDEREFRMDIQVNRAGRYEFKSLESNTQAESSNSITSYYPD